MNTPTNTCTSSARALGWAIAALASSSLASLAWADCDFPDNPPPGSIVTCTGTTTTPFVVDDIPGVEVTNVGTWTGSGDTFLMDFRGADLTGSRLINEGTMNWASALNPVNASRGAMSMFFNTNRATEAEAVNRATGVINVTDIQTSNAAIGGIVVQTRGANSSIIARNEGAINLITDSTEQTVFGMINRANSDILTENTGTIDIDRPGASQNVASGIFVQALNDSSVPVTTQTVNSGQIRTSASEQDDAFSIGMFVSQRFETPVPQPALHQMINEGTIETGGLVAFGLLFRDNLPNTTVEVTNIGDVVANGANISLAFASQVVTDANILINNTGNMTGDILLSNGNDEINMVDGLIDGAIVLEGGDDVLTISGGTITGDLFFGSGSDTLNVTGGQLLGTSFGNEAPQLNGLDAAMAILATLDGSGIGVPAPAGDTGAQPMGGDTNTLNFDGFTGDAHPFVDWNLVNLINSATVTFGLDFASELFSIFPDSTATLLAGLEIDSDVINDGTMDIQTPDASGGVMIIGNVAGSGELRLGVDVSGDFADVLSVVGDTDGSSMFINPVSVNLAEATGNDVLVVEVTGSTSDGDFTLPNGSLVQEINGITYTLRLVETDWFLTAEGSPFGSSPVHSVPTLSTWALVLLSVSMMLLVLMHRRQQWRQER